eukprot:365803-Chlamydomonas_euryale.AAC.19
MPGDPAQVGVVGPDERLQLVVCEAAGFRYSVEKGWGDVDAAQQARVRMLPGRRSAGSRSLKASPAAARRLFRWGFCNGSSAVIRPKRPEI